MEQGIHAPVVSIFKWLMRPVTGVVGRFVFNRYFKAAYEVSNLYRHHRDLLGRWPHSLGARLEYDLHLRDVYLNEHYPGPLLWIRSVDGQRYSRIVVKVSAQGGRVPIQDVIVFCDVDDKGVMSAMPRIPFEQVRVERGMAFAPYDELEISVLELFDAGGNAVEQFGVRSRVVPIFDLEVAMGMRKGNVTFFGKAYNCEMMEGAVIPP